jgi:hypothetical protein
VDVVTDFYLEFNMDPRGDLEIRPGGMDFFNDAREKLLRSVSETDQEKVREATSKGSLVHWVGQEETITLPFARMKNGIPVPYLIQTIRTRESDSHHIVLGIRQA